MPATRDGRYAVPGSWDNTLKVRNLSSVQVVSFYVDGATCCCAGNPDGRMIVAGEVSGRLHFLRRENVR